MRERLRRLEERVKALEEEETTRVRLADGSVHRVPSGAAWDLFCSIVRARRKGLAFDPAAHPYSRWIPVLREVVEVEPGGGQIETFFADCLRHEGFWAPVTPVGTQLEGSAGVSEPQGELAEWVQSQ